MSWDEAFASRYDEWSAEMTADVAFYMELARKRRGGRGARVDRRDMRELALDEPAALIYCPFRSLLHLPMWADRRRTFERVATSLRPGGRFAWNAFAFDHQLAARLDGSSRHSPAPSGKSVRRP